MSKVNTSAEYASEECKYDVAKQKSVKEPQTTSCQVIDSSLSQVSALQTSEVGAGKISLSAVSSLAKLIANDIASYIEITEDRINLTFSFLKSDFSHMSLAVLQELDKSGTNKGGKGKHESSEALNSTLTNGSDIQREGETILSKETLNRSFLSEIAYMSDINNTSDILSAFMKERDSGNPEIDCSESTNNLEANSTESSTILDSDDPSKRTTKKGNSEIDKSLKICNQYVLKTTVKDNQNSSYGTSKGTVETETSIIYSQEATPDSLNIDAENSKFDNRSIQVSADSVEKTPKQRKSLELQVDSSRSPSKELCVTTMVDNKKDMPNDDNDLKDETVCLTPEYSPLNSRAETEVLQDNTDLDLSVCVTKNSPEIGKTNGIMANSATDSELASVPHNKELNSTKTETDEIEILRKSTLDTSKTKTSALKNFICRAEYSSFNGDDKHQSQEQSLPTSTNLKSDVWPKIDPFTKVHKIPAKEISSRVSADVAIKYYRIELPDICIVVKVIVEGAKETSVEIGEYKESDSCRRENLADVSKQLGNSNLLSRTQQSDRGSEMGMLSSGITKENCGSFNVAGISSSPLHETTRNEDQQEKKVASESHSVSDLGIDVEFEEYCNISAKDELLTKCVSGHSLKVVQNYQEESPKKDTSSNLGTSNKTTVVSPQRPVCDIDNSVQKICPETSCENISPSTTNTVLNTTSAISRSETPKILHTGVSLMDRDELQNSRLLDATILNTSSKCERASHTSTPSRTPKRLSLMFTTDTANDTKRESLPGKIMENYPEKTLPSEILSVTKHSSHEATTIIPGDVSCSTVMENQSINELLTKDDESVSNPLAPNNLFGSSTLKASKDDHAIALRLRASRDNPVTDSIDATEIPSSSPSGVQDGATKIQEEALGSPPAIEDALPLPSDKSKDESVESSSVNPKVTPNSPAVKDEAPSTSSFIEDEAASNCTSTIASILEDEVSPSLDVRDETLPSVWKAKQTETLLPSGAVADEASSSAIVETGALLSPTDVNYAVPSPYGAGTDEAIASISEEHNETVLSSGEVTDEASTSAIVETEASLSLTDVGNESVPSQSGVGADGDIQSISEEQNETILLSGEVTDEASTSAIVETDAPLSSTDVDTVTSQSGAIEDEPSKSPMPEAERIAGSLMVNKSGVQPFSHEDENVVSVEPSVGHSDLEVDPSTAQSKSPSFPEGEEEEISLNPPSETNNDIAATHSSVASIAENAEAIDSATCNITEGAPSEKSDEASDSGLLSGVASEDGQMSDESSRTSTGTQRGRSSSTESDTQKSKSSSRTKRAQKYTKSRSNDEVDLAPTRVRSRNPPLDMSRMAIPENSAVSEKYERSAVTSPTKRVFRSRSLEPSLPKTPVKSSGKKSASAKPSKSVENEGVTRIKKAEAALEKPSVRSSPRKAKMAAIDSIETSKPPKSSNESLSETLSAKLRNSSSNIALGNATRRSKRGAKE